MSRVNRRRTIARHGMQSVFVFLLLGLFAVMSTLLVLLGAQMYRSTVERSHANNQDRILEAYVRSMLRSGDARGAVGVEAYDAFPPDALPQSAVAQAAEDDLVDFGDEDGGLVDFGEYEGGPVDFGDEDGGLVDLAESIPPADDADADAPVDLGDGAADTVNAAEAPVWVRRSADARSAPEGAVDSLNAIVLTEEIDGETYVTRIYPYEGQLRELFARQGYAFRPENGDVIVPAKAMDAALSDGLMTVRLVDGADAVCNVRVALRGEEDD